MTRLKTWDASMSMEDNINAQPTINEILERFEKISENEIELRNRVDITLKEYEDMKNEIISLTSEVRQYEAILQTKGLMDLLNPKVIMNSVEVSYIDDEVTMRRKGIISFEIDLRR